MNVYILYTFSKEYKLCEIMIILKIFLSTGYPSLPFPNFLMVLFRVTS